MNRCIGKALIVMVHLAKRVWDNMLSVNT
jgi:hypothetical protein